MLINHAMLYAIARGLPGIISFLTIILYTRMLHPKEYGYYALVIAGVMLINTTVFQWIRLGLLRLLPSYEYSNSFKLLSTIKLIYFTLVIATSVVLGLVSIILKQYNNNIILLIFIGIFILWLQAWFDLNLTLYRSRLKPKKYAAVAIIKSIITLSVGFILIKLGFGATGALLGMLMGLLVPSLTTINEWPGIHKCTIDKKIFKELINYGVPLTVTFAMGTIIQMSDRIILGLFFGAESTGGYAVAYDLTQQTLFLLMLVINLAGFPIITKQLEENGKEAAKRHIYHNTTLLFTISIPATVGFVLLSNNIATVLLGMEYADIAKSIMPIIAFTAFLQGIKMFYIDLSFQLGRKTKVQIIPVVVAAITNLVLNLSLIPLFGLLGAAYASVISYLIAIFLGWRLGSRIFKLPFPTINVVKIMVATILMGIMLKVVPFNSSLLELSMKVIIGIATYSLVIIILDLEHVRSRLLNKLNKLFF